MKLSGNVKKLIVFLVLSLISISIILFLTVNKKTFQAIQNGGVVCVAGDGRIGDHQKFPFLRGTIDIALGGFKLAERFSLPLITVISLRTKSGYLIDMQGPSFVGESNLAEIIHRSVSDLERCTGQHPEQYGWMYYAKAVGG